MESSIVGKSVKKSNYPLPVNEWLIETLQGANVQSVPISSNIAYLAGTLPEHHKDPADRIIIATSIENDMQLISFDTIFPSYKELRGRLVSDL